MTRHRIARAASWLIAPMAATLLGCGAESGDQFQGTGEFLLTTPGADGKAIVQRVAARPRLSLRRGMRGGTDVVLDSSCALRSLGGKVTGTYSCRVASSSGAVALELQSGTWKITEQSTGRTSGGCPVKRYNVVLDASGTIRGQTGTTATLHFAGKRELKVCGHSGGGVYGGTPWAWPEDPYTSDSGWEDGYDWDGDGDWDGSGSAFGDGGWGGGDDDWGDDDGGWDDGDWGDDDGGWDGDDGDWGGDDGDWGGDDGDWGGDDGDWGGDDGDSGGDDGGDWGGDDGNWVTGRSATGHKSRKARPGQTPQGQLREGRPRQGVPATKAGQ